MKARVINLVLSLFLALTSIGCIVFGYLWIDLSISTSYSEGAASVNDTAFYEVTLEMLKAELLGISEAELEDKIYSLKEHSVESIISKKLPNSNDVRVESLVFEISSGKVVDIRFGS
jgi:hypothetical protein